MSGLLRQIPAPGYWDRLGANAESQMKFHRFQIAFAILVGATMFCGCAPDAEPEPTYPGRCAAPDGVESRPQSIEEAMLLADSLPKPLTVACFVEALDRPMKVIASTDFISAQPAAGADAPRIFVFYDQLIISFVPDGEGSHVIEFGEERPFAMSVKAELNMPVTGAVTPELPFEHITAEGGTTCGGCHAAEVRDDLIDYAEAYSSEAIRPALSQTVRLDGLEEAAGRCDPAESPERCEIFDALFYRGELSDADFPRSLPTIYD